MDRAILDKEVVVGQGCLVGDGPDHDTPNRLEPGRLNTGITVVGKRTVIPRGMRLGRNVKVGYDVRTSDFAGRVVRTGARRATGKRAAGGGAPRDGTERAEAGRRGRAGATAGRRRCKAPSSRPPPPDKVAWRARLDCPPCHRSAGRACPSARPRSRRGSPTLASPLERADREGVSSWDLVLDGRSRADLRITLILDPSLALLCWAHFAPPIGDAFRKSYRQFLRWNDEYPFLKFSLAEDERPVLAVEIPVEDGRRRRPRPRPRAAPAASAIASSAGRRAGSGSVAGRPSRATAPAEGRSCMDRFARRAAGAPATS